MFGRPVGAKRICKVLTFHNTAADRGRLTPPPRSKQLVGGERFHVPLEKMWPRNGPTTSDKKKAATVQNHVRHKKKSGHGTVPRPPPTQVVDRVHAPLPVLRQIVDRGHVPPQVHTQIVGREHVPLQVPQLVVREERSHHDHSIPTHNSHNHPTSKYGRPCSGLDWHPGWVICLTTSSLGLNPQSSYFQKLAT